MDMVRQIMMAMSNSVFRHGFGLFLAFLDRSLEWRFPCRTAMTKGVETDDSSPSIANTRDGLDNRNDTTWIIPEGLKRQFGSSPTRLKETTRHGIWLLLRSTEPRLSTSLSRYYAASYFLDRSGTLILY